MCSELFKTNSTKPYYVLKLYVDTDDTELVNLYEQSMYKQNEVVEQFLNGEIVNFDAGFDLFCPTQLVLGGQLTHKVNHKVKMAMEFMAGGKHDNCKHESKSGYNSMPVGYYLYPRSSTGTKTPLRLANSVGIIDSGYRGNIIAVFDNWQEEPFTVEPYQRLTQICTPNLTYPMYVRIVKTEEDLGLTYRGSKGFGSTGK